MFRTIHFRKWIAAVLVLTFVGVAVAQSGMGFNLVRFATHAGGSISGEGTDGNNLVLVGVIGQPEAATSSGSGFGLQGGFLFPMSEIERSAVEVWQNY